MIFAKSKRVRLKGRALSRLNSAIHTRDHDRCVVCGAWVHPSVKFHHEPCGVDKSDEIEKGVVLCRECHFERHNGKNSQEIRKKIVDYLKGLYGKC